MREQEKTEQERRANKRAKTVNETKGKEKVKDEVCGRELDLHILFFWCY